jgi:hypothetical protein
MSGVVPVRGKPDIGKRRTAGHQTRWAEYENYQWSAVSAWRNLPVICQEPYMRSEQPCSAMRLRTIKKPRLIGDGVLGGHWEQLS